MEEGEVTKRGTGRCGEIENEEGRRRRGKGGGRSFPSFCIFWHVAALIQEILRFVPISGSGKSHTGPQKVSKSMTYYELVLFRGFFFIKYCSISIKMLLM